MNLKSGRIYWPTTMDTVHKYSPLQEDKTCDVCIIGSGSSGAFLAYQLAKENIRTVVMDKRKIGMGSTSANTGLLQYSNDKSFSSYINSFGLTVAKQHLQNCYHAIEDYQSLILPSLENNPDFEKRKSLYFASQPDDLVLLQDELYQLKKHQFPVRFLSKQELSNHWPFTKEGAIITEGDAVINPFKNVHYLLSAAMNNGVEVYEESEVVGQKWDKDTVKLYTKNKCVVEARFVVYATGYEAYADVAESNARIISSFAIATNPIDVHWPEDMLIWETARPYLYLRRTEDHRIIIGGLDEKTAISHQRDHMLFSKRDKLVKELQSLFPDLKDRITADYYWTGFFGETYNGFPMIKQHPSYKNGYYLLTYGGNGTVYSMILAKVLKDYIIHGERNGMKLYYKQ